MYDRSGQTIRLIKFRGSIEERQKAPSPLRQRSRPMLSSHQRRLEGRFTILRYLIPFSPPPVKLHDANYLQGAVLRCQFYRAMGLSGSRIKQAEQQFSLPSFPTRTRIVPGTTGGPTFSTTCFPPRCSNRYHPEQKCSPCWGTISARSTDCFRCTMKSHSCS